MLDSQTTHNLCCNSSYVTGIHEAGIKLNMSGNAGMLRITKKAGIKGLYPNDGAPVETWFNERCITIDTSFTVHRRPHGLVDLHFKMHESGLHMLVRPNQWGRVFTQTVENNMSVYTC